MFLAAPAAELNVAVVTYAEATATWSFPRDFRDTEMPGWAMAEFIVGEATLGWQPSEIIELLRDTCACQGDRRRSGLSRQVRRCAAGRVQSCIVLQLCGISPGRDPLHIEQIWLAQLLHH